MWNIRGIVKKNAMRRLKKLIKINKISFLAILEPKKGKI